MNEFISQNWWWLIVAIPAVLVGLRGLVKSTKPKWDDKLFLPILGAVLKIFDLLAGKRGKK
jgi:hypothetical protein